MKKYYFLAALLFLILKNSIAQTTIWQNDFENSAEWTLNISTGQNDIDANLWVISDAEGGVAAGGCGVAGNGNKTLHVGCQGTWCVGTGATYNAGDGGLGFISATTNKRAVFASNISTLNSQNLSVEFDYIGIGQANDDFGTVVYSTDGGTTWTNLQIITPATSCSNGQGLWTHLSIPLPVSCENSSTLRIGFNWTNSNDGTGTDPSLAINNLKITTNIPPVPQAGFNLNASELCQNYCFTFTNTSSDASTYFWDFGNGNSSNLENPQPLCFNLPGQYVITLIACNSQGCDTTTQNVTVLPSPSTGLEFLNGQITSLQPNALYQWLLCPSLTIIPGATSVEYTPPINGEYAVIVTLANGCSDTSDCIVINDLGVEEQSSYFTIFPNPGNGTFSFNLSQVEIKEFEIYDLTGRKQEVEYLEDQIKLITNEKGLFLVHITLINGSKIIYSYLKDE
jgi:PKD repeat protein